jgi:molybdopterin-guanine dinucleotide biosynthesis protein A
MQADPPQPISPPGFTAVVLAGDRKPDDPLVRQTGACCKALVTIDGLPMLDGVVATLQQSQSIQRVLLSGPTQRCLDTDATLKAALENDQIDWVEPQASPSTSAYAAMQGLSASTPVLVTTADHPLLRADIVDHFLREAISSGADVVRPSGRNFPTREKPCCVFGRVVSVAATCLPS